MRRRGIKARIPSKADQDAHRRKLGLKGGRPPALDPETHKQRHAVECGINQLTRPSFRALLQTADYATAVCPATSHKTLTDADVTTLVRVRMLRRRSALDGSRQKELVFLVDETALRRPVGSRATMRDQLERLLNVAEHPAVSLTVVPFQARPHAGHLGPFMLLHYGEGLDDVLCFEWQLGNRLVRDQPGLTARYRTLSADLVRADADGATTKRLIVAALNEIR
jgi:hypothetical protein